MMKARTSDDFDRMAPKARAFPRVFAALMGIAFVLAGVAFYRGRSVRPDPGPISFGKVVRVPGHVAAPNSAVPDPTSPAPTDDDLDRCRERIATHLAGWGMPPDEGEGVDDPEDRERLFHRYFDFLSLKGLGEDALSEPSPEAAFLRRLPPTPLGRSDKLDDPGKLRGCLAALVVKLDPTADAAGPAADLLGEVARLMDYNAWKRADPAWSRQERGPGEAALVDPGLSQLVDRFRRGGRR